jgi:hypothetical protein
MRAALPGARARENTLQKTASVKCAAQEAAIVGALISAGGERVPDACLRLLQHAPDSFDDVRLGIIGVALRKILAEGRQPDAVAVHAALKDAGQVEAAGGLAHLVALGSEGIPLPLASAEAELAWSAYQARQVASVAAELAAEVGRHPDHAGTIARFAADALVSLSDASKAGLADAFPGLVDAADFLAQPIDPPAQLVAGLLHKGSKLALGGSSKSFKTWSLLDLALSVASGSPWLGRETAPGRVLFLNFEIQPHPWQSRIRAVAAAKGIELRQGMLTLWNLRGFAADHRKLMPRVVQRCQAEGFSLVVLDPVYKLYSAGMDENAAGDVAALLNAFEELAVGSGAAVAFGAHFAKGNSAGKEPLDRISGSGVFARDPDSLLMFTKHEEEDCFTVDAILRNFAPAAPFVVRWEYPLMRLASSLDPAALRIAGGRTPDHRPADLLALLPAEGLASEEWQAMAEGQRGMKRSTFFGLRRRLQDDDKVIEAKAEGKFYPVKKGAAK